MTNQLYSGLTAALTYSLVGWVIIAVKAINKIIYPKREKEGTYGYYP